MVASTDLLPTSDMDSSSDSVDRLAHDLSSKVRTADVTVSPEVTFHSIARIKPPILQGLTRCGFRTPSPIQAKTLPLSLIGMDLIVQSKSGTGKTVVFAVTALQALQAAKEARNHPQVLILAPTREIAQQITDVIKLIGRCTSNVHVNTFIGGIQLDEDREALRHCNIAVGCPGRIAQLIEMKSFKTTSIRLLVLDEADKLISPEFRVDINRIFNSLPARKQMLAVSATYEDDLAQLLKGYMRCPQFLSISSDPSLIGVKQYFIKLPCKHEAYKADEVLALLTSHPYSQCIIFCNVISRAESIEQILLENDFSPVYIHGKQETKERLKKIDLLKNKRTRILISSDLVSRGIDSEFVDLVINLDVPFDVETYYHRIGRAGRFGSHGTAFTILLESSDECRRFITIKSVHSLPAVECASFYFTTKSHSSPSVTFNDGPGNHSSSLNGSNDRDDRSNCDTVDSDVADESSSQITDGDNFRRFLHLLKWSNNNFDQIVGPVAKENGSTGHLGPGDGSSQCKACSAFSSFAREILNIKCQTCKPDEQLYSWTIQATKKTSNLKEDEQSVQFNCKDAEKGANNSNSLQMQNANLCQEEKSLMQIQSLQLNDHLTEGDFVQPLHFTCKDNSGKIENEFTGEKIQGANVQSVDEEEAGEERVNQAIREENDEDEEVEEGDEIGLQDYEDEEDEDDEIYCDEYTSEWDEEDYHDDDEDCYDGQEGQSELVASVTSNWDGNFPGATTSQTAPNDTPARVLVSRAFFPKPWMTFTQYQEWTQNSLPYFKYLSHIHQFYESPNDS